MYSVPKRKSLTQEWTVFFKACSLNDKALIDYPKHLPWFSKIYNWREDYAKSSDYSLNFIINPHQMGKLTITQDSISKLSVLIPHSSRWNAEQREKLSFIFQQPPENSVITMNIPMGPTNSVEEGQDDIWDIEITIPNNEFAEQSAIDRESILETPTSSLSKSQLANQKRRLKLQQLNEQRLLDSYEPIPLKRNRGAAWRKRAFSLSREKRENRRAV